MGMGNWKHVKLLESVLFGLTYDDEVKKKVTLLNSIIRKFRTGLWFGLDGWMQHYEEYANPSEYNSVFLIMW